MTYNSTPRDMFYNDDEDAIESRIPVFAGDDKKMEYLSYRSLGFSAKAACSLADVKLETVRTWRNQDPTFKKFEGEKLTELQKTAGKDLVELTFKRNMFLLLDQDFQVINKAHKTEFTDLSAREWEYYKAIRKHYTPQDLLALEKALNPDEHKDNINYVVNLTWNTGDPSEGRIQEVEAASPYRELPDGNSDS